ncbi:MAG: VOC family protein [Candidatus Nanopelagicales bacterium]
MHVTRVTANLLVGDLDAATAFYRDVVGLSTLEFDLGWVARVTSPTTGAHLQLLTTDATAPEPPAITLHVTDVASAYAELQEAGVEIVHPLTVETWGVHRFLFRAPDGTVVNVVEHRD